MRSFAFLFVLGLAVWSSPSAKASNAYPAYECHGCDDNRMLSAAYAAMLPNTGVEDVVAIYNLRNNKIKSYHGWWTDPVGGGDPFTNPPILNIRQVATAQPIVEAFARLRTLYVQNGNSLTFIFQHNGTLQSVSQIDFAMSKSGNCRPGVQGETPYDFVRSSSLRNTIRGKVSASERWSVLGRDILALVKNPFSHKFEEPLVAVYDFADGGSVVYTLNFKTRIWEHVPGSVADCENNQVPEKRRDFVNGEAGVADYRFSGTSHGPGGIAGFTSLAESMGIMLVGIPGGGSGGSGIVCTRIYDHENEQWIVVRCTD